MMVGGILLSILGLSQVYAIGRFELPDQGEILVHRDISQNFGLTYSDDGLTKVS